MSVKVGFMLVDCISVHSQEIIFLSVHIAYLSKFLNLTITITASEITFLRHVEFSFVFQHVAKVTISVVWVSK